MRKSTKIAVVLAAAALLVAGFAFTTLAKGWVKEAEGLYYYEDAEGMKVYNEWKKDTDPNTGIVKYYYLGDDGYMVMNTLVETDEGKFWCGPDGAKVVSTWQQVPASEEDQDNLEVDYRWYWFDAKGKAVTGQQSLKNSAGETGTYFFDADCKMVYGYVNVIDKKVNEWTTKVKEGYEYTTGTTYFCQSNEEGWAVTSTWRKESQDASGDAFEDAKTFWAFYQSNGKRAVANGAKGYLWNGVKYFFNDFGKMLTGWQEATRSDEEGVDWPVVENYGGADEGIKVKKAWKRTTRYNKDDGEDDEYWFYFDNSGAAIQKTGVYKINGKFYAFGEELKDSYASPMLAGMVALTKEGGFEFITDAGVKAAKESVSKKTLATWLKEEHENVYFFSADEKNDGSLKKSVTFSQEFVDDTYTLAVDAEGKLRNYQDAKTKKYYKNGYLLTADADQRYAMVEVWLSAENKGWDLLSTNGAPVASGTVSDVDGSYYYVVKATDKDLKKIYKADSSLPSASKAISAFKNKGEGAPVTVDGQTFYVKVLTEDDVVAAEYYTIGLTTVKPVTAE